MALSVPYGWVVLVLMWCRCYVDVLVLRVVVLLEYFYRGVNVVA